MKTTKLHHHRAGAALLATSRVLSRATLPRVIPPTLTLGQARALLACILPKLKLRLLRIETSATGRIVAVVSAAGPARAARKTHAPTRLPISPRHKLARPIRRGVERVELFALAASAIRRSSRPPREVVPSSSANSKSAVGGGK